ncbi:MAG TPA: NlpC/P60 family protein [Gaiellaceae bacterium]|nr:NlpC/P60 family protein [Gaiellaceae bacterium]
MASVQSAAAEPTVAQKRAQAQSVLAQIQEIDGRLGSTIEAWNGANLRLTKVKQELQLNQNRLVVARTSLEATQTHLEERLVALYVGGGESSAMEVLLGAESLDDLMSRLDAVARVSEQDARVLRQVKAFKAEVQQRKAKLQRAQAAQKREVAALAARRASIEGQLRERQRLLASIKDQIASLEAAEARRQARLQAEARRRVAALAAQRPPQSQATEEVPATAAPIPEADALGVGSASPAGEPAAPAPPARYGGVVGIAMQYLGVPYRWGGESPSTGFDCSGFTKYVFGKIGVSLPHYTGSQWQLGAAVSKSDLQAGDLVFFNGLGHMGIYIGGGNFIHAPRTGDVVKISSLSQDWYSRTYMGARRL